MGSSFTNVATGGLFGGGSPDYGDAAKKAEEQRQAQVKWGVGQVNKQFAGYDPDFFRKYYQTYINYAMPQLMDQYQQAREALTYGMANRGLLGSTAAGKATSRLNRQLAGGEQQVADTGQSLVNAMRQNVEAERGSLLNTLYASSDPAQATQSAIGQAASYTPPSAFTPIGNMFSNLAQTYYLNALMNMGNQGGAWYAPQNQSAGGSLGPTTLH